VLLTLAHGLEADALSAFPARRPPSILHAGLILQLDAEHESYRRLATVCWQLGDRPLSPCLLVRLSPATGDSTLSCLYELLPAQQWGTLAEAVAQPRYDELEPPVTIDITRASSSTDVLVSALAAAFTSSTMPQNGSASSKPASSSASGNHSSSAAGGEAASDSTECSASLQFTLGILRTFQASDAIDLSGPVVCRHLMASGAGAEFAAESAAEWAKCWGDYLVDPSTEGIHRKLQTSLLKLTNDPSGARYGSNRCQPLTANGDLKRPRSEGGFPGS